MNKFIEFCKDKAIKGNDDGIKKLFIGKKSFEEMFEDNDFVGFLKDLKDNDVMSSPEVKELIVKALDYFLNEDKISQSYEKLKDESGYFEDPVTYASIEKNIKELIPNFDLKPYKKRIERKIGISNAKVKEKDTTNKQLNFVWQLLLSYSIDEESPSKETLEKVYYEETMRGLSLFGYGDLGKMLLKEKL